LTNSCDCLLLNTCLGKRASGARSGKGERP
jgi:hypothetical protein